jgi:hypothetical protein
MPRARVRLLLVLAALSGGCGLDMMGLQVSADAGSDGTGGKIHRDAGKTETDGGKHESADADAADDVDASPPVADTGVDHALSEAGADVAADGVRADGARDSGADAVGRDAPPDDATGSDATEGGTVAFGVAQHAGANDSSGSKGSLSVSFSALTAGSFVAVLVTYSAVSSSVTSITDNGAGAGNAYVSAGERSSVNQCQASEIWYARDVAPGATTLTATVGATGQIAVWVLEVSGMSKTGGVDDGAESNGQGTVLINAPTVRPTGDPALIVAAVGSCGQLGSLGLGSPFTGLGIEDGNGASYYIATKPGAWGPVYSNNLSAWNASVADFR